MKWIQIILLSVLCVHRGAGEHDGEDHDRHSAFCEVDVATGSDAENIQGMVTIDQMENGDVKFKVELSGFDTEDGDTEHGFHIHAEGDMSNSCMAALGHFNPHGRNHGAPDATERHVGDLGNIQENAAGEVSTTIVDSSGLIEFEGADSIIGRGMVIHERADDLGLGGASDSLTTGSAGGRMACCVIEKVASPNAGVSLRAGLTAILLVVVTVIAAAA